jgi:hypothetical protein
MSSGLDVIRFYNGQSAPFQQKFVYTKPDTDFREENGNAYWNVDAPPKSFFEVPFELETSLGGIWRISIHTEITQRFGNRGVIRVDIKAKKALEENPGDPRFAYVAHDDESAKVKGDEIWRTYLRQVIQDFEVENDRRVTERGLHKLRPNNYVAHAYRELGMEIPGEEKTSNAPSLAAVPAAQQGELAELRKKFDQQQEQIRVLLERDAQRETGDSQPQPTGSDGAQQDPVGATAGNGKEKTNHKK